MTNETIAFDNLRRLLAEDYPSLHVFDENGQWMIRGTLPVYAENTCVDHYQIAIQYKKGFPRIAPDVWEVGGRIERITDRHIFPDGRLCLFTPLERWKHLPEDATIITYIKHPLNDFLFSQTYFDIHKKWPFGERSHGKLGIQEYLSEELDTSKIPVLIRCLQYLTKESPKGHWLCYCGSRKKMRHCHFNKIRELSSKISRQEAFWALQTLIA